MAKVSEEFAEDEEKAVGGILRAGPLRRLQEFVSRRVKILPAVVGQA